MSAAVGFGPPRAWRRQQIERKCGFTPRNLAGFLALSRRKLCVLGITACCKRVSSDADVDLWEEELGKCHCWCGCGRRHILASVLGMSLATATDCLAASAQGLDDGYLVTLILRLADFKTLEAIHPKRPDWYQELYARVLKFGMVSYEAEYKEQLFENLRKQEEEADAAGSTVLELGIGTGPNLKYYAGGSGMNVVGVDPNDKMEKYARAAASDAGLLDSNFKFIHAVGEEIPLPSSSVDAVISTLVLCSVTDLDSTLKEINRVLKPGATFYFLEHVAAQDGSNLRFWQGVLDPVQQFVADGCHLTRDTLSSIQSAGLETVAAQRIHINSVSLIAPHIIGTARSSRIVSSRIV